MNVMTTEERSSLVHGWETEQLIRRVLFRASTALDREDFPTFLACCTEDFSYKITAYSPEIRKDMTWFAQDFHGMKEILDTIHKHNRDRTPIVRHWSTQEVAPSDVADTFDVTSTLQVYRTALDGGETSLYAVGRYLDTVRLSSGQALLVRREVRLDTRMLGVGYHIPF